MKQVARPKVSIVIPVYNGSNFLGQAIDSALAQTYDNIEVVVVDDGSTDDGATEQVAVAYGDKIQYYRKQNGGVASAMNFGIQHMTGEYFSWLSHDDLYEKTKAEDQVRAMLSLQGDRNIIVSNARTLFKSGIKKEALIDKKTFDFFDIFLGTEADVGINGCALLIPRKVLLESGGFDPALPVTQDYDLWNRLSTKHHCKFVLLEKNLVLYRRHEGQDSVQKQQLCLDAGDALRHDILTNIPYARFKQYFVADAANIQHAWSNYQLYKARGYRQTISLLLANILQYYYEYDRDRFYAIYVAEIESGIAVGAASAPARRHFLGKHALTADERSRIDAEYAHTLQSSNGLRIKNVHAPFEATPPSNKALRVAWRLGESVRQDGVYLTGEKLIRKVYAKTRRKR